MNFNIFNKKKNKEKDWFKEIDDKYNCEVIIQKIEQDLKIKLSLDEVTFDDIEKCVVIKAKSGVNDNAKIYNIIIREPILDQKMNDASYCYKSYYESSVLIDKGNDCYVDYVFNSSKEKDNEGKEHYSIYYSYRTLRYINGDVSIILNDYCCDYPDIKYIVTKGDKRAEIITDNTNWRLDAVLQKLTNLEMNEIYNTIKSVDHNIVLDISINIYDDVLKSKEMLLVYMGNIEKYNKKYVKNDTIVSLEYENGKLVKRIELIEDNIDELKTNDIDVKKAVVKIKTLN